MTAMECGHGVAQRVRYGVGGVISDSFFKPDPRFGYAADIEFQDTHDRSRRIEGWVGKQSVIAGVL